MAMTNAERKRKSRDKAKTKFLDVKVFSMELTASEREAIEAGSQARGFEDQTEYLLSLVYQDRDMSQKKLEEA